MSTDITSTDITSTDITSVDTIITGVTVLAGTTRPAVGYPLLPPENTAARGVVTFLENSAIGIRDGVIAWIVPADDVPAAERDTAVVIDGAGQVAMPGLMNSHTHSPMTMFRGSAEDVPTKDWFNKHIWPMETNLTDRDVVLGARLAIGEMLLAGVTSFADHYFSMDLIAGVVEETGARALLASTFFSSQGEEGIRRSADFAEQFNGAAGGRITTAMGPHAPYTVTDADLRTTAEHAARIGVRTHIHTSESPAQTVSSLERRGVTPVQVLNDTGILETGVLIAHGAGIIDDDLRWLTPYADRVSVASCTKVYLNHAQSGTTPVRMLHDAGITVGIGTDGAAGHNTLDVIESMRLLSLMEKHNHADATWLTSQHALDLATRQSAEAFGLADQVGTLQPGFKADIVLIDPRKPHMQPMHDLAAALVLSLQASDVTTVLVDGRVVVRNGALVTLDLTDTMAELNARIPGLTDTSHGKKMQDYAP